MRAVLRHFRVEAVDRFDAEQAVVLLAVFRGAHLAGDVIAGPKPKAADLRLADVDIVGARQQALAAQEAVPVIDDLQDAAGRNGGLALLWRQFGLLAVRVELALLLTRDSARA